jgi:hypothetical protein
VAPPRSAAVGLGRVGVLALLLAACNDYNLFGEAGPDIPFDSAGEYDGEGDGNGLRACPALEELPGTAPVDESCIAVPQTGPLLTRLEWERTDFGGTIEYTQVVVSPLVGQLTDDDGDGQITRMDHPDVVIVADDDGKAVDDFGLLAVLDGVDGSTITTIFSVRLGDAEVHPYRYATPVLADLDADGTPEIVAVVRVGYSGGGGGGGDGGEGTDEPARPEMAAPPATPGRKRATTPSAPRLRTQSPRTPTTGAPWPPFMPTERCSGSPLTSSRARGIFSPPPTSMATASARCWPTMRC